jgi:hypothetical protein
LTELRQKLAEFGYLPESDASAFGIGSGNYLDDLTSSIDDEDEADDVAEAIAALRGDDPFARPVGGEDES